MAVASTAALICDTGALLDYIVKGAPDHQRFRHAIDRARTRYVPGLVLAEVDYFLRDERPAMNAFMHDVARGAFTYAPLALVQLARAMEIDRRYGDLGLGLVDASVVALAEDLGIRRLATRDVRHFAAVRLRDGSAFEVAVHISSAVARSACSSCTPSRRSRFVSSLALMLTPKRWKGEFVRIGGS